MSQSSIMERLLEIGAEPDGPFYIRRNALQQIFTNIIKHSYKRNKDKLYKLRPLINSLNDNLIKLYNVSYQVSIDESMILFKGRSSLKQYNPMKPIKRGY